MGKKFKGMYMQKCGLRDGSLVPVTALLAQGLTDSSLKYHLQNAKNHGVTQKEIAAVITHAAFHDVQTVDGSGISLYAPGFRRTPEYAIYGGSPEPGYG